MVDYSTLFTVDSGSPSGLRWVVNRYTGKHKTVLLVTAGDVAGYKNPHHGYWVINLGGKSLRAHRVVWEIINGKIPLGMVIDHIDVNLDNNCITNLRMVSQTINARNKRMLKCNTSGVTGVKLNHKKYKDYVNSYWVARWADLSGKEKVKHFSIDRYGHDEAFRLACEYRELMISELNKNGAGYTEMHGEKR